FGSEQVEAADFCGAFDEARDVGSKNFFDLRNGNFGVFDDVVKERGAEGGDVEFHLGEKMRDFNGMREEGFAGKARLRLVLLGREIEGAAKKFEIVAGAIAA